MALLLSALLIVSAVSAMPLNTDQMPTEAPVLPQFTFTPIPVNEPSSTVPPVDFSISGAILTQGETSSSSPSEVRSISETESPALIEQPQPVPVLLNDASIAVEPVIEASTTQPEHVTATQIAEASSVSFQRNDAVEPVAEVSSTLPEQPIVASENTIESFSLANQNDAVAETTTSSTVTASERSAEPAVLVEEPAQVQIQQLLNEENIETSTDASTAEIVTFEPVTATSEISVQNDATGETVTQSEIVEETTILDNIAPVDEATSTQMPGDQPQLDFVDETAVENTAYQYLNMADSSADNLVINISMPSAPSDLLKRLQQSTLKLNYGEKLDVALQLTALAHTLMSSVDNQLDALKQ